MLRSLFYTIIFVCYSSSYVQAQDGGPPLDVIMYPDVIPASTATFKTYNNNSNRYPFVVSYPSDWIMTLNQYGTMFTMSFDYQVDAGPDSYPLEIDCDANPSKLTAQQWSETQPQLTPQAPQRLASGVEAFVATGQGEGAYTAYSVVKGQQACTLFAFTTDAENQKLISKVVNFFQWK